MYTVALGRLGLYGVGRISPARFTMALGWEAVRGTVDMQMHAPPPQARLGLALDISIASVKPLEAIISTKQLLSSTTISSSYLLLSFPTVLSPSFASRLSFRLFSRLSL